MVKFQAGHSTYVGPGEWQQERDRSAAVRKEMELREKGLGADLERLAQEMKERKFDLENAPEDRALKNRDIESGIKSRDALTANIGADNARQDADRATDDARYKDAQDRDAKARTSGAKAFALASGPDLYNDGTPDALETGEHDAETGQLKDALSPLMADMDPADQARVSAVLDRRRQEGRYKLRGSQVKAKAMRFAKAGMLDEAKMADLDAHLAAGADPESVDRALDNLAAAHEKEAGDDLMRQSAMQEAKQTWEQMQALGLRLKPGTRAQVAALAARINSPITSGEDAMKYAEEIRKLAYKDAAGDDDSKQKPWYESKLVEKWADAGLSDEEVMAKARAYGIPGVPEGPGGGTGRPSPSGTPGSPAARGDLEVLAQFRDRHGRDPSPEELADELRKAEAQPAAQDQEVGATGLEPQVVPDASKLKLPF